MRFLSEITTAKASITTAKASVLAGTFPENCAIICISVNTVFKFFTLFRNVKDKQWKELFVIFRCVVRRRNQFFNIVKFCSKRRGIAINSWKFLWPEMFAVIINFWIPAGVQHYKHVGEIAVVEHCWAVFLVSTLTCLKSYNYPARFLWCWLNLHVKFLVWATGKLSYWIIR